MTLNFKENIKSKKKKKKKRIRYIKKRLNIIERSKCILSSITLK